MAQTTGKKKVYFTVGGSPEDRFAGTKVGSSWSPGGRSRTRFLRQITKFKRNVNVQHSSKPAQVFISSTNSDTLGTASRFTEEVSTIRKDEIRVGFPRL